MNSIVFRVPVPIFMYSDPDRDAKMKRFSEDIKLVKLLNGYIDMNVVTSGYDSIIEFHFSYSDSLSNAITIASINQIFAEAKA